MKANGHLQMFPFLRVCLVFILGIVTAVRLQHDMGMGVWLCVAALSAMATLLARRSEVWQSVLVMASFFFIGGTLACRSIRMSQPPLPGSAVEYEAVVAGEPTVRGKVVRCDLLVPKGGRVHKVLASIYKDPRALTLKVGDGIKACSLLETPRAYPGATFDYGLFLRRHGYSATTFIYTTQWQGAAVSLALLSPTDRLRLKALAMRRRLVERYRATGMGGDALAVAAAMTLGDKSMISRHTRQLYSATGASHVLALSGLHLSIIYFILLLMAGGSRRSSAAILMVTTGIWAYVLLVGMPISVVRSAVMMTVYALATILHRDKASVNALSFAAMCLLVASPMSLYDVGFQMSFVAVLSILVFFKRINATVPKRLTTLPILKQVWQVLAVSLSAQVGVWPLVALYFGNFSCYFLLTNIIVIPCVTILLYAAVAFFVLAPLPSVQVAAANVVVLSAEAMNRGLLWVASLPGSAISNISMSPAQVLLYYALIAVTWMLAGRLYVLYRIGRPYRGIYSDGR